MDFLKVGVGSANPVKINAVKNVLEHYEMFKSSVISPVNVMSVVSPQPKGYSEISLGAVNRAKNSKEGNNYSIGIESGIDEDHWTDSKWIDYCVCAVYDGNKFFIGRSSGIEVPKNLIKLIFEKEIDLSQACHISEQIKRENLGYEEGLIGILTNGRITREKQIEQAIINALAPLENSNLYYPK